MILTTLQQPCLVFQCYAISCMTPLLSQFRSLYINSMPTRVPIKDGSTPPNHATQLFWPTCSTNQFRGATYASFDYRINYNASFLVYCPDIYHLIKLGEVFVPGATHLSTEMIMTSWLPCRSSSWTKYSLTCGLQGWNDPVERLSSNVPNSTWVLKWEELESE